MGTVRTEISEIVTGLALFGFRDLERALAARPRFITNVDDSVYDRLDAAFAAGSDADLFHMAWDNGRRFARAEDGLRGRPPWLVEWKGPHRPPAYEQIPADLRVDHVYLISCKYGSNILMNASPWHLFDRSLADRRTERSDWYLEVAPEAYQELYAATRLSIDSRRLPDLAVDLGREERELIKRSVGRAWPADVAPIYNEFAYAVAPRVRRAMAFTNRYPQPSRTNVVAAAPSAGGALLRARGFTIRRAAPLPGRHAVGLPQRLRRPGLRCLGRRRGSASRAVASRHRRSGSRAPSHHRGSRRGALESWEVQRCARGQGLSRHPSPRRGRLSPPRLSAGQVTVDLELAHQPGTGLDRWVARRLGDRATRWQTLDGGVPVGHVKEGERIAGGRVDQRHPVHG